MSMIPFDGDITRCLKWMQQNAPAIQSIVNQKAQWYDNYNTQFWEQWQKNVFDLRTANNFGLMVWCIILGVPSGGLGLYPNVAAFAFGKERQNFIGDSSVSDPSTGGNFYGAGTTAVGSIEEIRKLLQLRYVSLTSRGNIAQTNRMLKYIFNKGQDWDFSAGKYFYVMDINGTQKTAAPVTNLSVFRSDWQGDVKMSPVARTNMVKQSGIPGAAGTAWDDSGCLLGFSDHWQGMVGTRIFANDAAPKATDSLNYGTTGGYLDLKPGSYAITVFYQVGMSGRLRVGITDASNGLFSGFSGVVGGRLSDISSNGSKATITLSDDVLFDQTNNVRKFTAVLNVKSEIVSGSFSFGPNTVLKDKDVILYGVQIESGSVFNAFITTPSNFASRASSAAYYDESNVMRFAAANVARSDSYRVNKNGDLVNIGLIMEPESTNYMPRPASVVQGSVTGSMNNAPMAVEGNAGTCPDNVLRMYHITTMENASPRIVTTPTFSTLVGKKASASAFFSAGENANFVSMRIYGATVDGSNFGVEASFDLVNGVVAMVRELEGIDSSNVIGVWADVESAGYHGGKHVFRCAMGATAGPALVSGFTFVDYIPASSAIGVSNYQQRVMGDDVYSWHSGGIVVESTHYPSTHIRPSTNFVSRSTIASYLDSTGAMKFAAINTLRSPSYSWDKNNNLQAIGDYTEGAATQLLTGTESFSGWSLTNASLITEATAAVSPTGAKMLHLVETSVNGLHSLGKAISGTALSYVCASAFVSKNGAKYVAMIIGIDTNDSAVVIFDTSNWEVVAKRDSASSILRCVNFGSNPFGPGIARIYLSTQFPADKTALSVSFACVNDVSVWPPVYAGSGNGVYIWGAQAEEGVMPSSYISGEGATGNTARGADILGSASTVRSADVPTSVTSVVDYTLSDATNGGVTMGQPPLAGAGLYWTGNWNGATQSSQLEFGTGDSQKTAFVLSEPLSLTSPTAGAFQLEYRVGPNMGLSSQLINLLNDETMELLPRTAGVKATVIQEA